MLRPGYYIFLETSQLLVFICASENLKKLIKLNLKKLTKLMELRTEYQKVFWIKSTIGVYKCIWKPKTPNWIKPKIT